MTSRSRPGSARPRASKTSTNEKVEYECKAAYLVIFESIDDHITTRKQLIEVMQQAGRNPTKKVLKEYWTNDTDSLSFDDFVEICRKEKPTSEDELIRAFRKIDLNGDGYIDNSELKKVLTTRGERMTTTEVQDIIDEVDENGDGRLDYKEFSKMMLSTQEQCKKLSMEHMEKKMGKKSTSKTSSIRDDGESDSTLDPDVHMNGSRDDSDDDSDDDIIVGTSRSTSARSNTPSYKKELSPPKPRPRLRRPSQERSPDLSRPSPRVKERAKSPIAGKDLRLPKPKRLKDWTLSHSKGCFYFDDDNKIISHQYEMKVTKDTSVWITIEPISIRPGHDLNSAREESRSPIDTMLFVLRDDDSLVTFTEMRDIKGKYGIRCDLERGTYKLIPFTTGCRFKPRTSEPSSETKLVKRSDDRFILTKAFKEALGDIFEMCDLDGNGLLSRSEFNYFNLRTSGEEVNDKEWEVVEGTLELKNGEITRQGFVQLNQMEADDNEGDTEELWVTLSNMGFNKALDLDETCPFIIDIYSETCTAKLTVSHLEKGGRALEQAVVDTTMGKGEAVKIAKMRDLFLHTYMNDFRACMVIENKSHHSVKVSMDSSRSENCSASTPHLDHTFTVPSKSSMIGQHLMPSKETRPWTVRCQENIIK